MYLGEITELWRYPVKSMQGEMILETAVGVRGLLGDRAYAILDRESGHIASAKNPRKWRNLFACQAMYAEPPQLHSPLPPVWITLPDATRVSSTQPDIDLVLSNVLGRDVTLVQEAPSTLTREADRTPIDGSSDDPIIREEPMALASPTGTFFDYAPIHILTTATMNHLHALYPEGDFAVRRFRPNIVVAMSDGAEIATFPENAWLGQMLSIGKETQLRVIDPCPRCIVTTLAQISLPADPRILRTVAQHNSVASVTLAPGIVFPAVAGVYATATREGRISKGNLIR